ncbi:MAG: response regulator transcription factor [Anaerolineales bacterium]|nr:response regulator transcription factor [Anaerolineales bacterium]
MAVEKPIRVLIVDDHAMVRKGLAAFLLVKADLELAGEASNGEEALRLCEQLRPEVILMDLKMPKLDGVAATRAIKSRYPHIQVIALTSFQEKELVQEAIRAGAISYLLKNVSADDLAEAIRAASAGRSVLDPQALQALVQDVSPAAPDLGHDLTAREREVLALLVQGLTNPAIAARLVVSRATVKAHVSSILAKLGASTRAEAIRLALQHQLVP